MDVSDKGTEQPKVYSAYHHIRFNPEVVKNGFKKAGITGDFKNRLPEQIQIVTKST